MILLAVAGQAQQEPGYKELPNFHKVSDTLYRGGQPTSAGAAKLAELGIKTIINLRGEEDVDREGQKQAEAAGLRYFNVPMPGLSAPSDEQIARVIKLIDDPENQPVFIHCKRGADRTGTVAAIYRIKHEGWTSERAIGEAKRHGMSWAEFGMRSYISNYYKAQVLLRDKSTAAATATSR
ncbi:MAG: tyrosine-protein phosphatase [Blastocatellia bacterium]